MKKKPRYVIKVCSVNNSRMGYVTRTDKNGSFSWVPWISDAVKYMEEDADRRMNLILNSGKYPNVTLTKELV